MDTPQPNETILIVDDTPESLQLLYDTLNHVGYRVLVAENANSAMIRLEHATPDLILLDIMMPGIDGFELFDRLRKIPALADTPVIFISALTSSEAVVRGLNLEAVDFITKPFNPHEVRARVKRHLKLHHLQKQIKAKNSQLEKEISERKKAEAALKQRNYELATINHTSQVFLADLEINSVIPTVLKEIYGLLDIAGTSIWLQEPATNEVVCQYAVGIGHKKLTGWRLTVGQGITGRVAKTGQPMIVADTRTDPHHLKQADQTVGVEIRSMLSLPLQMKDNVLGTLNVVDEKPEQFSTNDLDLLGPIGAAAAIAIENARLFEQVNYANEAKSEFMSIAAHELKIPMTSIKGYAKLLQMGAAGSLTDKQADFLEIISNNVDRMNTLVSDLLDVSRIESGRIRLELTDVHLQEVIEDVYRSLESQIEKKKQTLTLDIAPDLPEIRADFSRMVQIVTNLLGNAHKYTPEGGQLTVTARPLQPETDGVKISVADTGYGISEEDLAQLFTNFFRSNDENIRNEPGTGLGLAITKNMIESHGGQLTVESELGVGSTFTFTMPLQSQIPPGVEVTED